jgi:hypothetical protein
MPNTSAMLAIKAFRIDISSPQPQNNSAIPISRKGRKAEEAALQRPRSVKAPPDAAKLIETRAVARTHKNLAYYHKRTNSFDVSEVISPVA